MELIGHEQCRVFRLIDFRRERGSPYLPEVAAKLIAKYHFAKFPTVEDMLRESPSFVFQLGKFQQTQIAEFGAYSDGFIVSGKCGSAVLDAFLDEIIEWAQKELEATPILPHRSEKYYETSIVVQSNTNLVDVLTPGPSRTIRDALTNGVGLPYVRSAMAFDCDPADVRGRRKPFRFFVERKLGVRFEENIFLCQAPLPSEELLELLRKVEGQAS